MHYSHILRLSATDRRETEAYVGPRDSTKQCRLPPMCPSSRLTGNHVERRSIDNTLEWPRMHYSLILGLSATDRRETEAHAGPRDSTKQ